MPRTMRLHGRDTECQSYWSIEDDKLRRIIFNRWWIRTKQVGGKPKVKVAEDPNKRTRRDTVGQQGTPG